MKVVEQLYAALSSCGGDAETVETSVASEMEWWFHGPPGCQYLMHSLTGCSYFNFAPQSITVLGNKVLVEGCEDDSLYWVHVWTVENGIITQVREYFNTCLVVKEFKPTSSSASLFQKMQQPPSWLHLPLWQSKLDKFKAKSMPGLVLAI